MDFLDGVEENRINEGLIKVLKAKDLAVFKHYLENGADADARHGTFQVTALHLATQLRLEEAVDLLLQCPADVNAIDSRGISPLHIAAGAGSHVFVGKYIAAKAFIDHHTVFNSQDGTGRETPLHWAAHAGHSQVLVQLLDAGAKVMIY